MTAPAYISVDRTVVRRQIETWCVAVHTDLGWKHAGHDEEHDPALATDQAGVKPTAVLEELVFQRPFKTAGDPDFINGTGSIAICVDGDSTEETLYAVEIVTQKMCDAIRDRTSSSGGVTIDVVDVNERVIYGTDEDGARSANGFVEFRFQARRVSGTTTEPIPAPDPTPP